jgi:hypothetical protein
VPVVPQSLSPTPVTADLGPAPSLYDMNAAFMSFQPHDSGIHAVWSGAGESSVTEVRFRCAPLTDGAARADQERIKNSPS